MLDINNTRISFDELRCVMNIVESFNAVNDPTGEIEAYISFEQRDDGRHLFMMFDISNMEEDQYKLSLGLITALTPKRIYDKIRDDIKGIMQAHSWIKKNNPKYLMPPLKITELHKYIIKKGNLDPGKYMRSHLQERNTAFRHYNPIDNEKNLISDSNFPMHVRLPASYAQKYDKVSFPQMAGYVNYKHGIASVSGEFLLDENHMISVGTKDWMSEINLNYQLPETIIASLRGKLISEVIDHDCLKGSDIVVSSAENIDESAIIKFYDPFVYANDEVEKQFPQDGRLKRLKAWSESKD